jgi:hypothetical protein
MDLIRIVYVSEKDGQEHIVYAQQIINHNGSTIVARFMDGSQREFKEVVKLGH